MNIFDIFFLLAFLLAAALLPCAAAWAIFWAALEETSPRACARRARRWERQHRGGREFIRERRA